MAKQTDATNGPNPGYFNGQKRTGLCECKGSRHCADCGGCISFEVRETVWLVERPLKHGGGSEYWNGGSYFSVSPSMAVRFARKLDAECMIERDEHLQGGFKGEWRAVQHCWVTESNTPVSSVTSAHRAAEATLPLVAAVAWVLTDMEGFNLPRVSQWKAKLREALEGAPPSQSSQPTPSAVDNSPVPRL